MTPTHEDLRTVLGLERELQTPRPRRDASRLRELLAADFAEIGASGRRWDREAIVALLTSGDEAEIAITGLEARWLTGDVIQVFWESDRAGRRARRMSLWRRGLGGWQQVYHQGTPLA
ncbi:MAG: DUF4440 domain-containing protein [Actinomycetia bacterium]|nr:DUF4440 domain-containing protein [Actinomycetes bacterium]